jgi:hypothetical protein
MSRDKFSELFPDGFQVSPQGIVVLLKQYLVLRLLCLYLGGLHDWCLPVDLGLKLAVDVNYAFRFAPQGLALTLLFCETRPQPS